MEWTDQKVLKAIRAYRDRPILWDPQHKHYKIARRKNEAWDALSKAFNLRSDLMKKKMNSLLASYRRERQRIKQRQPGCEEYRSQWFAFDHFTFLLGKFGLGKSSDNNCELTETAEDKVEVEDAGALDKDEVDDVIVLLQEGTEQMRSDQIQATSHTIDTEYLEPTVNHQGPLNISVLKPPVRNKKLSSKRIPVTKTVRSQEDPRVTEAYNILKNISSSKRDECTTYCEHVANKLRKLDDRGRAIAQHKINNILFEAEISIYNQGSEPPTTQDETSTTQAMKLNTLICFPN